MRPPLALIFVACLPASVTAQPSFDPTEFINKKVLHNAEVTQLWRTLGISATIRETSAGGAKETDEIFNCGSGDQCEAESVRLDWPLLEGGGYDLVMRISPAYEDLSRFLVFQYEEAGWRLVDYLDSVMWDVSSQKVTVVSSGGKRWLVLRKTWPRCGSNCGVSFTDWFGLESGRLRLVLTVPSSGYVGDDQPGRQFETRFVRAGRSGTRETLEFVYHVEFSSGFFSSIQVSNLWSDEKTVRFSRPAGQGEFKFDANKSEASEGFVSDIFSSLQIGPRFFELIQDHLMEIARGPHDRRRDWLKKLLEQNSDVPQLARVRDAFAETP